LNWRLLLMPEWVRDYVLVHELMHLKRLDHTTRRFWRNCAPLPAPRRGAEVAEVLEAARLLTAG
jgi:predicted metal-dependent hydrolase